eukprot:Gb_26376 [translate_table: standard]
MMPSIAYIDTNLSISSFKYRMPCVAFHIVRALIEITNSWDVILAVFTNNVPMIPNDYCSVPDSFTMI